MARPPATRVYCALGEICTKYGFCDVLHGPIRDIDPRVQDTSQITDAILRAEGIKHPELYDTEMRRNFAVLLDDWLFDPYGRGANSDLPLIEADD